MLGKGKKHALDIVGSANGNWRAMDIRCVSVGLELGSDAVG